jgi:hypothetical protein
VGKSSKTIYLKLILLVRSSDNHELDEGGRLNDNSPGQQPFVTSSSPTTSSSTAQFVPPLLGLIPQQHAQIVVSFMFCNVYIIYILFIRH